MVLSQSARRSADAVVVAATCLSEGCDFVRFQDDLFAIDASAAEEWSCWQVFRLGSGVFKHIVGKSCLYCAKNNLCEPVIALLVECYTIALSATCGLILYHQHLCQYTYRLAPNNGAYRSTKVSLRFSTRSFCNAVMYKMSSFSAVSANGGLLAQNTLTPWFFMTSSRASALAL